MNYTKEQALAAFNLLHNLAQERVNTMGQGLQAIVVPKTTEALRLLGHILEEHFKETEPTA